MDDLIAFLRARLDAKQKAAEEAKEASQSAWWFDMEEGDAETATNWALLGIDSFFARASSLAPTAPLKHIAANDPDTVLAEVDAKRQIIDECSSQAVLDEYPAYVLGRKVLQRLALPYAGHPDYREEWRP